MSNDENINRILFYVIILCSIILFMFIGTNVDAATIYGPSNCTSTHYRIGKQDGEGITDTFGVTSTSYSIIWRYITFYGTENMDANSYYDVKVTFVNNLPTNFINSVAFSNTTSLCGNQNGDYSISGYTATGKVLTFRVLTGLNVVDYWQVWLDLNGGYSNHSNGISSVTLSKVDLSGSDGIIENNNDNTNNIINNNNENTQDIIDNQTQNAQDIIDNQNFNSITELNALRKSANSDCVNYLDILIERGKKLNTEGTFVDSVNSYYSPGFTNVSAYTSIYILNPPTSASGYYVVAYDSSYSVVGYITLTTRRWNLPENTKFIRFSSPVANTYIYSDNTCIRGTDVINDTLTDSNVTSDLIDDIVDSDFYHNDALTSIITAPLTLLNSIIDTNNTCQPLDLPFQIKIGSFYDNSSSNVTLPCGSILWSHASSTIVNLYRLIVGGFIIFRVCTYAYLVIDSSIDPFKDKLEVIDL